MSFSACFLPEFPNPIPGTGLTPEICLVILRHKASFCEAI